MEIYEMRYFLAVAQTENVNKAAKNAGVSAGSLSKAISRLEDELQTPLFYREGRGIRLSPEGKLFRIQATKMIALEEDTKLSFLGEDKGQLNIYISSEEILQTYFATEVCRTINKTYPNARIHFLIRSEEKSLEQVKNGEAHFALITQDVPKGLTSKTLKEVEFKTCASKKHPLLKGKKNNLSIKTSSLLEHHFVSPESAILGKIKKSDSIDGWRDDKFPRKIKYKVCGLKLIENLISEGLALGYLPDYFIKASGFIELNVSDCKYSCKQSVKLITKDPSRLGWLNRIWGEL